MKRRDPILAGPSIRPIAPSGSKPTRVGGGGVEVVVPVAVRETEAGAGDLLPDAELGVVQ